MRSTFAIGLNTDIASVDTVCQPRCDFEMNGASATEITELIDGFLIGTLETEQVED